MILQLDGCAWARDLGGLPTAGAATARPAAHVRAGSLDRLSAAGWAALEAHGVRTVIDLRNAGERAPGTAARPASITTPTATG